VRCNHRERNKGDDTGSYRSRRSAGHGELHRDALMLSSTVCACAPWLDWAAVAASAVSATAALNRMRCIGNPPLNARRIAHLEHHPNTPVLRQCDEDHCRSASMTSWCSCRHSSWETVAVSFLVKSGRPVRISPVRAITTSVFDMGGRRLSVVHELIAGTSVSALLRQWRESPTASSLDHLVGDQ
jgi:hypothetical protein